MPSFTRRLLTLVPAALLTAAVARAQSPPSSPPAGRWEITVLSGYRIEGGISTKAAPEQTVLGLDDAATYGLALDWRIDRWADAEMQYSYTSSSATPVLFNPDTGAILRGNPYDLGIHDVTFGILGNLLPAGRPVRPYIGLGLGFTVLVPSNDLPSETKLTFSVAAGVRAALSPRFGLRFEARWVPVYLFSTGPGGYTCDLVYFSCSSNDVGHVIQQADFRLGASFRF